MKKQQQRSFWWSWIFAFFFHTEIQNFWVDLSSVTRLRIWVEVLESLMEISARRPEKNLSMKTENVDHFTVERERDETNVTNE
jgi:hypothetical protein